MSILKKRISKMWYLLELKIQLSRFLGISSANEISNIVMFLLSDATQTLTGQSIVIDGGYTL